MKKMLIWKVEKKLEVKKDVVVKSTDVILKDMDQILPKKEEAKSLFIKNSGVKKQKTTENHVINAPGTASAAKQTSAKGKKPVSYFN